MRGGGPQGTSERCAMALTPAEQKQQSDGVRMFGADWELRPATRENIITTGLCLPRGVKPMEKDTF